MGLYILLLIYVVHMLLFFVVGQMSEMFLYMLLFICWFISLLFIIISYVERVFKIVFFTILSG